MPTEPLPTAATDRHRRVDPQRRERIIDATLELIIEVGVRAVTHRAVARAAGASLSATTYYFEGLDDLLTQAFERWVSDDVARLRQAIDRRDPSHDLALALAEVIHDVAEDRDAGIVASELGVAALRNTRLANLAQDWTALWVTALSDELPPDTARLAVLVATGVIQGSALAEQRMTVTEIEGLLRRVIESEA